MKRIAVLLLGIMLAIASYGQNEDIQSNDVQSKDIFVLVKVFSKTGNTTASIDFGDGSPVMVFADEKEKARVFESNFEPINLLIRHGWEIEKFSSLLNDFFTTTLWVMKKKIKEVSEIKEGMKLIRGDKK